MGLLKKLVVAAVVLGGAGAAVGWYLTAPDGLSAAEIASLPAGDAARGERVFWTGGCTSCHAAPQAEGDAKLQLVGGLGLHTPFGTFVAPNISSHAEDGIGGWSAGDFANAMLRGVSPEGEHYYPAFPYGSYARMTTADVADLFAFMKTLPAVEGRAPDHALGFPFNIRRGVGMWKLLYLSPDPVVTLAADATDAARRGQYLVEGPGHCGECHTPRTFDGGPRKAEWLAGAAAAEGSGFVPNITPGDDGIGAWSESEIITFFKDGFTPDFDSPGGAMAAVQKNIAHLPDEDQAAIAAYLKAIPALPDGYTRPAAQ
ncbi:MAG: cytochrome c [Rhizobiaceae bacterium]|nr:cytochrome c [Rhizobiaceae bacterium]